MGALDANGSAAQASEGDFEGSSGEESGDRQRADDAAPGCRVCGRIRGAFPEGATVEAVVRTLSRAGLAEIVAARVNPGAEGEYELRFTAPADTSEPADVTLALRLRGPDGRVLVESTAIPSFPQELELDLRAPRGAVSRSEYELLEAHIAGELRTGAEGLDGLGAEDVGEVADWLDVEPEHVRLFQQARKLGAETGLPAPLFYSLGQAGLPTVLEELIEVPLHELETTLEEAVAAGVAPPALRDGLGASLEALAERIVESALAARGTDPLRVGFGALLCASELSAEELRPVLRSYQRREAGAAAFWEGVGESFPEVSPEVRSAIGLTLELGELVGGDVALIRRLQELRGAGRWHVAEDLVRFDFDDWCELLEDLERAHAASNGASGEELDEELAEALELRAESIVEALEAEFPSAFIRRELFEAEELGAGARQLLERAPDHDFLARSIHERAQADPSLLEGLEAAEAEAALEEVAAVERVSRITSRAEEVLVLVGTGMKSALAVAQTPQLHFVETYAEALGGREQAARVHAQAQQSASASRMAMLRLLQALQQSPFVIGADVRDLKEMPDARTLFGSIGLCNCEHCSSVYSPAAYFVDLLRYLDLRDPKRLEVVKDKLLKRGFARARVTTLGGYQPLDVLLARRPDLADIPLTCENTLTPLPYIDVVNEVLEARVGGASAAHDTGKTPADVLRAVPQNVQRDAYAKLSEAVYPLALPYHDPLAVTRAYLGHLGISRVELLRTLGRGAAQREEALAEALGMSPAELASVARPPEELFRHFGFAAAENGGVSFVGALARAPAFLAATGITFQSLIDLVSTRFVNAGDGLKLESPAPDCDPEKVRITGLDERRLSRLLRLLRLQRRIGWSFADLDRALFAMNASELDVPALEKLVEVRDLARLLDRPAVELLVLWAPLDTWGKDSRFEALLQTRSVAWRTEDARTFQLRPDRAELAVTAENLDAVAPALLAGFRITSEELTLARALLLSRSAPPRLDLAGLSAVYRVIVLARALKLRIDQLDALLRLVPPDADPFRPTEPAAARRFVDIARAVGNTDFAPETLAYLFRDEISVGRGPAPTAAQLSAALSNVRRSLSDAHTETAHPAEVIDDTLRQKLAMLLDPALLDRAVAVLDPRTPETAAQRRDFFDRHLAHVFPDPGAAAARLFGALPAAAKAAAALVPSTSAAATAPSPSDDPFAPEAPDPAAAEKPSTPAPSPLERHWQANVHFVLDHLLPLLRARRLRGAVVQTLSDSVGLSGAAVAELSTRVLTSRRRPGAPVIQDFYALLGSGLTGAYYANAELRGDPALVRVDPEIAFSWTGAEPAPGVPSRGFSVRWSGHFHARSTGSYTFYVRSDGNLRLSLKVGEDERVLIERAGGPGAVAEHASIPIELAGNALYELKLEYRNGGGPASVALLVGATPSTKQAVPAVDLYPADGLSSFAPVEEAYRRLHKAALLITGLGIGDRQLEWLTRAPAYLDLDNLPTRADPNHDAVGAFRRFRQLAAFHELRKKLPSSAVDLFDVFRAETLPQAIERLALATGWQPGVIAAFLGPAGFAVKSPDQLRPAADATEEPLLLRLARAMDLERRAGVAPQTLFAWAAGTPDADSAAAIVQVVKARYDEKRWLEVARSLNDPLRIERREALVAYLLPRMRELGVTTRNRLFEYFLIDVDMSPCMLASRIQLAIAAVQTFFQRCLMNLEARVPPGLIDENDWKWLKNYRVWEANRKIFLYPENWIEPELRDDKTPLFEQLERSVLQQEIKRENVENAFADYLQGLDEIARLDVRAVWFERRKGAALEPRSPAVVRLARAAPAAEPLRSEWEHGTYHVFARTFNAPYVWYYRRLERGRAWTPWEKVDADIESEHLLPVMFHGRLHLFWTVFREVNQPTPKLDRGENKGPPPEIGKDWEIQLAYSVFDRGRWSRKRLSDRGARDVIHAIVITDSPAGRPREKHVAGSAALSPADYLLRAHLPEPGRLEIHLHRRRVASQPFAALLRAKPLLQALTPVMLENSTVDVVGMFELDGCNGALLLGGVSRDPVKRVIVQGASGQARQQLRARAGRGKRHAKAVVAAPPREPVARPFHVRSGGQLDVPSNYRVDGMGYSPPPRASGALLTLRAGSGRGLSSVLARAPHSFRGVHFVPVEDALRPSSGELAPFFFQDRFRSYFARPVYAGYRPPQLVAYPLVGRLAPAARTTGPARPRAPVRGRPGRGGRGRREELEESLGAEGLMLEESLTFEESAAPEGVEFVSPEELLAEGTPLPETRDAWSDGHAPVWHPEDTAERQPRRHARTRTTARSPARARPAVPARPAPAAAPAPQIVTRELPGGHEYKLRFEAFEHAASCRLIDTLKSGGVEALLALETSRSTKAGLDHAIVYKRLPNGNLVRAWVRRKPSWFERQYGPGPLVAAERPPHLDIDFDPDSPYSIYNWEIFFFAPFQIATRLAKDGNHEEAQRWFHFVFDPTSDVSSPAPQRYWRFAPFHENSEYAAARELMALLSYGGGDESLIQRQKQVHAQLATWWEKPFNPHAVARLRIAAYQKAVVMRYIDNLVEWADKLFRRDTRETIQEATQLYILAESILGPRPERVPPMIETKPLTFRQVREGLDVFSNFEVRFESSQIRRPFAINAAPAVGATTQVLGMATQYFCVPPNPQMDKYWDTIADRLFKIRNCMNIQGVVRQLALFDPPLDPGLLARAAAAGVDLSSVISSLNAPPPHYRFRFLAARAVRLCEELQSFGAATLRVLERRDAEGLAALRAANEGSLLDAIRDIKKKQVRQVEEELSELALEREHVELKAQYVMAQLQELMNPQEAARQSSLTASQVLSGVIEGVNLAAKVAYAIPEIQAGVAGGFSSPFSTFQLGGQMFGDIAMAFAESVQKIQNKNETEAELAAAQAEYQRRRAEWQHELELLAKQRAGLDKRINETQLKLEIASAELRRHDLELENARKVERYLRDKYTNEQLYGWMLGQLSGMYFQAYKFTFDAARQAERAYRFERGEPSGSFIEFSYWDSLKKGLFAGERLLLDLRRMEAAFVEGDRRALEVSRAVSLREDFPLALEELLATGRCQIAVTEALLDGDFPGHFFRRLKTLSLSMLGPWRAQSNVNATLTLLENRIRIDPHASGTYGQAEDGEDARFLVNFAPVQAVATSRPTSDPGLLELRFDDERYLPFEGAGAIATFRLELRQSDNAVQLSELADVVLALGYSARSGGTPLEAAARGEREKSLARGGLQPPALHHVSLRRDLPEVWKQLAGAGAGQEISAEIPLLSERLSGRYRGLELRVERVQVFARGRVTLAPEALRLRLEPPRGSAVPLAGWGAPWPNTRTLRATAEVSGSTGTWKLGISTGSAKLTELVDDLALVFELRARKR